MFIEAKLVFQSYIPTEFKPGMLFLRKIQMLKLKTMIEYYEVFELKEKPRDTESFLMINGWPVLPFIYSLTANPDSFADILATPDQIGWWDDGPDTEDLRDISIKEYNYILENYDGHIDIEIDDNMFEDGIAEAVLYNNKITVREPMEEYIDDYDEDTAPDDYEDWDDIDDDNNRE
jgi:hypothetical protein